MSWGGHSDRMPCGPVPVTANDRNKQSPADFQRTRQLVPVIIFTDDGCSNA
jgi:hypothetical protein